MKGVRIKHKCDRDDKNDNDRCYLNGVKIIRGQHTGKTPCLLCTGHPCSETLTRGISNWRLWEWPMMLAVVCHVVS